jgi:hypothetical protein
MLVASSAFSTGHIALTAALSGVIAATLAVGWLRGRVECSTRLPLVY